MTAADKIATARALIEPLTGHTPGPWDASGLTVYDTCMEGVASCHAGADARLIAAAPALRDTVAALADLADAQAQEIAELREALAGERERIASNLDTEADVTPCAEDAAVVRSCARLVRADFSHEAADALGETP